MLRIVARRLGLTRVVKAALRRFLSDRAYRTLMPFIWKFGWGRGAYLAGRLMLLKGRIVRFRIPGDPHYFFARGGSSDLHAFKQVFVGEQYLLPPLDGAPQFIIDGGANVGYSARYFAKRYPRARILAVEPEASNFELLQRNTRSVPTITPIHAALWDQSAPLTIEDPLADKWAFRVRGTQSATSADTWGVSITELMATAQAEVIDILKLDIEGAEKRLFENGSDTWLPRTRVLIVELHDRLVPGCSDALRSAVAGCQMESLVVQENVVLINREILNQR